jgi:hypothetical protein
MSALPEDLQAFLDAERDIDPPARAERARLVERLEPLLVPAALVVTGAAAAAGAADGTGSTALGAALKAKIGAALVVAALAGGAAGVAGHEYVVTHAAPREVATKLSVPVREAPAPIVPAERVVASLPQSASASPSVPAASAPSAQRQEQLRPAGSLRAERLLIETASAALMRGDQRAALAALRRHAQRFPHGELAEEREALLKKALAASAADAGAPKGAADSE